MDLIERKLFRSFRFSKDKPHLPAELLREIHEGCEIVEIDEKLFFHIKFQYRAILIFEAEGRFALRVGASPHQVAEFFSQEDRYFLRPPSWVEN